MFPFRRHRKSFSQFVCFVLTFCLCGGALRAQQQTPPPVVQQPAPSADIAFDTLLSADSYKLYLEVRNVGQLLTNGGAGEIVEPIIKLADPGPQLKSVVGFLKEHAEELATSRLFFVTWPARTGIPTALAAIEFASPEEAAKFTPRLEKFLPDVLPPVSVAEPTSENSLPPSKSSANAGGAITEARTQKTTEPAVTKTVKPAATPEMRLPFVLTQSGSLVFISDKPFQAAKLHPRGRPLLAEDNNFRLARDRFASEPLFFYCNVKLEDKTQPKPSPTPVISEEEKRRIEKENEAAVEKAIADDKAEQEKAGGNPPPPVAEPNAVLTTIEPSPTPTPTKEEEAQRIASNQVGSMLSMLGQGEPHWPDAIGLVVALDNDEYVLRAILIESDTAKRVTLPFVPQLISGPPHAPEAPSILPDDTELLVSTSIDFTQTYQELKKQAENQAKAQIGRPKSERWENGVLVEQGPIRQMAEDGFVQFEKKAGFRIADDLLPVLGNELAIGMSLKQANMVNMFGIPTPPPPPPKSSTEKQKGPEPLPIFMIAIRDREAARRLMPRVLEGLGIGEAKLIAQNERVGDSEIVNFAGVFSYAFIGNFLVASDSATVRRVAEASMNGGTLGSNNAFRTSRHWQPRQTLGEIYVSPTLMEGYQEQISKQAGTMDQSMRDFLMKLSPKSSAITYSLWRDGLGTLHELHLPKNLILAIVASTSAAMNAMKQGSPEMNEMIAMSALRMIAGAEETFKSTAGNGSYGSIDELAEEKLLSKEVFEKYGYRFDLTTSAHGYEAVAMPSEYGKSGRRSFFIDQSNVLRAGDHGGGAATVADQPISQ
jgi:hypothetical protein